MSQSQRQPPKEEGRIGDPDDNASMVAILLSDEAGFITWQKFVRNV